MNVSRARVLVVAIGLCLAVTAHAGETFDWKPLPKLPQPLSGHFVGVSNEALVTAGGAWFPVSLWEGGTKVWLDKVFVLETDANQWKIAEPLPHSVAYGAAVSTDDGIVCAGGSDGTTHFTEVFRLRWVNDRIERTSLPDLPRPCAFTAGALVNNIMYVVGGLEAPDSTEALDTFWALDLGADKPQWQELEPWPGPARMLPVVAAQGGAVYVFSGADLHAGPDGKAERTYLTDGYRYRPEKPGELEAGWKAVTGPPKAVVAGPAVGYGPAKSFIFVFTGDDGSLVDRNQELKDKHPGFSHDVLAYHTVTDTWVKAGEIAETLVTTQAVNWDGRIVIPGGEDRPGHRSDAVLSGKPVGTTASLHAVDYGVMLLYFAVLVAMGLYFSKREKSTDDFFLGGKRIPWWAAGLSIYGTLLSAITFLAVPAEAFTGNWIFYVGNVMMILVAPVVIYCFLPFFRRLNVTTAYEYLEKRFNVAVRLFGSTAFIVFQLGRVGIVILLPALALSATTGVNVYGAIILMGALCMVYTVLGGIEAVIWTDVLQVIILMGGAILSFVLIVAAVDGGLSGLIDVGVEHDKFRMVNWGWDFTSSVLWVVVLGRFLETLIPYSSDQTVVQRYLTTATEKEARKSIWFGMLFSVPNGIIFFGLGTALFVFYKEQPELLDANLKGDAILPLFIVQNLPIGVAGLIIAAVFAAAMSSLDSSLNSMSAVLVTDFYRRFKKEVSEHAALTWARTLTIFAGILGTCSALLMAYCKVESLWQQYMKLIGLFGGGLVGIFALGIFTRRATGPGALVGAIVGAVVLFCVQNLTDISFLLYSTIGICTSFAVGYVASLFLGSNPDDMTGLCWATRTRETE